MDIASSGTEKVPQTDDPYAGYAPDFEQLLLGGAGLSETTSNETDFAYPPLPILHDTGTSQEPPQVWSPGLGPNQALSYLDTFWETSRRSSGTQNSPGLTTYSDPCLSDGSQPASLDLPRSFVDPRNLLEADSRLNTLKDDLKSSCILGTNTRKRQPRPSFTAPPSQMRSPPYGFMDDGKGQTPFARPESPLTNHVSVLHQVPAASDHFFQPASTAKNHDQSITAVPPPSSTQNHRVFWEENGNKSDSTSHDLVRADYTQQHQDLKYSTEYEVEYAYNRTASQADNVHTSTNLGNLSTSFLSPDTLAPSRSQPSASSSRIHF